MVASYLGQWDPTFDKGLDDLEAGHGLLACRFG
jgi:hypothetical protein